MHSQICISYSSWLVLMLNWILFLRYAVSALETEIFRNVMKSS